ncbi:unnamed protein product [Pleuronectes platessa]|uniref:Uncharacterized protein n=1 Tax=Pleuronectes platessa TaxID=8262 RepID=A0A9N7UPH9_PLEPL|nr:unnamed protein product [Pleuronectes platessa]
MKSLAAAALTWITTLSLKSQRGAESKLELLGETPDNSGHIISRQHVFLLSTLLMPISHNAAFTPARPRFFTSFPQPSACIPHLHPPSLPNLFVIHSNSHSVSRGCAGELGLSQPGSPGYLHHLTFEGRGESIPADNGGVMGYTLDRSGAHHRADV